MVEAEPIKTGTSQASQSESLTSLADGLVAEARVDTLILGCTHYPLLRGVIEEALPGVALVDSGAAVAGDLARALARLGIEAPGAAGTSAPGGKAAQRDGAGCGDATRLAEYHGVPAPYLAKHLQALSRAGIVESSPGPRGGYRLARPAACQR